MYAKRCRLIGSSCTAIGISIHRSLARTRVILFTSAEWFGNREPIFLRWTLKQNYTFDGQFSYQNARHNTSFICKLVISRSHSFKLCYFCFFFFFFFFLRRLALLVRLPFELKKNHNRPFHIKVIAKREKIMVPCYAFTLSCLAFASSS